MTKRMLIDAAHTEETRVIIVEHGRIADYDFVTTAKAQLKGNVYLAKITRVEPSLQAAFVEYGGGKQGFLPFSEIHPDYYQLPSDDKRKLLDEQIAEAEAEEAAEDEAFEREQAARESRRSGRGGHGDSETDELEAPEENEAPVALSDPEAALNAASSETASEPTTQPKLEVSSLEMPQTFAPETGEEYPSQPLIAESFATSSDLADELPEDTQQPPAEGTEQVEGATPTEQPAGEAQQTAGEEAEESRGGHRSRGAFHRRYRIQEVIRRNQIVLVQVIKEERGNKGCSLTTFISLAGRSAVLMPNSPKGGGISRKITDRETRRRLKEIASEMRTHRSMSVIIRTAGLDRTKAEIRRDYEYLVKLWNQIREQTLQATAPALIYEEGNLVKRSLRDLYTTDIEEIIIEGDAAYEDAKEFMRMLMPSQVGKVKLYKEMVPLFSYAGIEDQLAGMTEPQVKLPSGGYIVLHPTEALISIDVNSGRSTTERNVEETALKTNLEAAAEVARQLRLRDLAGLIVIDFIDMNYGKNRKHVERAMKDALRYDRAKIQMGRISTFGLMELSRQRMRPSIAEAMGVLCPHCRGTGYIHSVETIGIQIIRTLEKEAASGEYATLRVTTHPEAALHLLNEKRAMLQSLEQRYRVNVVVLMDASMITGNYRLIKVTLEGREVAHEDSKQPKRSGRKRGKRGGKGLGEASGPNVSFDGVTTAAEAGEEDEFEDDEEDNEPIGGAMGSSISEGEVREVREPRGGYEGRDRDRNRGGRGGRGGRGRDRNRGGRDRHRHDEQRPAGEVPQENIAAAEGQPVEGGEAGQPREPRGERGEGGEGRGRRRGRRGGRGRNREGRGPRENSQQQPHAADAATVAEYTAPAPREETPRPAAPQHRQSFVIPLSEAQTNPAAVASPIKNEAGGDGDKKRKGWWSRVLD